MARTPLTEAPDALLRAIGPLARRFTQHDGADVVLSGAAGGSLAVVTGFGPTNAPRAGTLSVMLGIIELQRYLAVPTTVVISELGAWNSRNVAWGQLLDVRDQMIEFLKAIGFDLNNGELRSHLDHKNLVRCGRIARFLSRQDFLDNREDLLELYGSHGLLGSEAGIMIDALYTVADILGPAESGAARILMVSGAEEAYFTDLARLVLARQQDAGELGLGWGAVLGALYFRVLEGLAGYPKMSKSIPASSIHLGMPASEITRRILADDDASQRPLLSAIELSSGWPLAEIEASRRATDAAAWSARVTHAHPEGIAGAVAVAVAAAIAGAARWRGTPPDPAGMLEAAAGAITDGPTARGVRRAIGLLGHQVEEAAWELGNGSRTTSQDSVPFALWAAAAHISDYPAAITACVRAGGDVDTTAAMAGGIVATWTGIDDRPGSGGIPRDWLAARELLPIWATRRQATRRGPQTPGPGNHRLAKTPRPGPARRRARSACPRKTKLSVRAWPSESERLLELN